MEKLAATALALFLTGVICGCHQEPPKCSDEKTLTMVKEIILKAVGESAVDTIRIQLPRPSAYDSKIKKYSCDGSLVVDGNDWLDPIPIKYESQFDDKENHVVTVQSISPDDMLNIKLAIANKDRSGHARAERETEAEKLPKGPPRESETESTEKHQGAFSQSTDISGTWSNGGLDMTVEKTVSHFVLSFSVNTSHCTGYLEATGSLSGNKLTVVPDRNFADGEEDSCKIIVSFLNDKATIKESNCTKWHGAQCNFDGTLMKVK